MAARLIAEPRSEHGKSASRTIRRVGRVPAIMYGHGDATRPLSVDALELDKLLSSISAENTLVDVEVQGSATRALIREVQRHPYKPVILHVDFLEVHAGEALKLDVPVRLLGAAVGVRENGGVLQQVLHELHIECLPSDIPEAIELDIENLAIGDSVYVRDVNIPRVTILNDGDLTICSVTQPTVAELPEEPVVEEVIGGVQPELVGKAGEDQTQTPASEQGD